MPVSDSGFITRKVTNHPYPCTNVVVTDGQRLQLSPDYAPQSPLAGLAESEKSQSASTQHGGENCKS
jgi:hypothetical protein